MGCSVSKKQEIQGNRNPLKAHQSNFGKDPSLVKAQSHIAMILYYMLRIQHIFYCQFTFNMMFTLESKRFYHKNQEWGGDYP